MSPRGSIALALVLFACGCGDSTDADGGGGGDAAMPVTFPDWPTTANGPDGDTLTFVLVDPFLDQQMGEAWATIGYDLDGHCSVWPDEDVPCLPPSPNRQIVEDGMGCRDNVSGNALFSTFEQLVGRTFEQVMDDTLRAGLGAPILVVSGWSGERDDPSVEAGLAFATHGTSATGTSATSVEIVMGLPVVDGASVSPPGLDGGDDFFADSASWDSAADRPLAWDDAAYVTGGQLVIRLPDRLPMIFGSEELTTTLLLTDARLVVDVSSGVPGTAVLVGRWPAVDLLERGLSSGADVCPGTTGYGFFEALVEIAPDLRATPGTGGSAEIVCDAVSVAIPFTRAARVNVAGVATLVRAAPCE